MGGVLCVAIRRSNGEESVMERWTNDMPGYLIDPLFRNEDEATLALLEKGAKKRKMIGGIQYGLIAVDFVNKEVLSRQGYCIPFKWTTLWHGGYCSCVPSDEEIQIMRRLLNEDPAPQILQFGAPSFEENSFSDEYIAKLKDAVNNSTGDTLPSFVESMTFLQRHPFTLDHSDIYRRGFNWKREVHDWLSERGWTSRIAKRFYG